VKEATISNWKRPKKHCLPMNVDAILAFDDKEHQLNDPLQFRQQQQQTVA